MRAVRLHPPGGLEGLVVEEVPTPTPGAGEALVRVHAAAITRDELTWPADRLPATPSYELSGVVEAVGSGVADLKEGDPVYGLLAFDRDGAAAEYVLTNAARLAPKPERLDDVASAAVPLAGLSAWQGLFDHGKLAAGERVLIHGAAGGVGHLAVQLARANGAFVIGTTSENGVVRVRMLGADQVIDDEATPFEDEVGPVDLVFDTVGGDRLNRSPAVIREGGRLVSIAEEGAGGTYFVVHPSRQQLLEITKLIESGGIRPIVAEVFALEDALAAFARTQAGGSGGKVVLRVSDTGAPAGG